MATTIVSMAEEPKRPRGRPTKYPERKGRGAPWFKIRLDPELIEQVKARGGSAWVRGLIREALERDRDHQA